MGMKVDMVYLKHVSWKSEVAVRFEVRLAVM